MVTIVFRSRLRDPEDREFHALADRMLALVRGMPGFVSYKVFSAADGERCSLIEFESEAGLRAWREHPEHLEAQRAGRERFYESYALHVSGSGRVSAFQR